MIKYNFVPDIGSRLLRNLNTVESVTKSCENLSKEDFKIGNVFLIKSEMRDIQLEGTNEVPDNKMGDYKATGDSCGGHGLGLDMEGTGLSARIWLNKSNLKICEDYLAKHGGHKPAPKKFEAK